MNANVIDLDTLKAQEALAALRGRICSKCGQELDHQKKKGEFAYPQTKYTCRTCRIAHCPYCGSSAQSRCHHLIASNTYGKSTCTGVVDGQPPRVPAAADQQVDWSEQQKRDIFGAAYPLLRIYGQGMRSQPTRSRLMKALTYCASQPTTSVEVNTHARNHHFEFAAQPDQALQEINLRLSCLQKGMKRLAETPPDANGVLVGQLCAGPQKSSVTALGFSSDGRLLATAAGKTVTLWYAATGEKRNELSSDINITSLAFSPDNALLTGASDEGCVTWSIAGGQTVHTWRTPNCRAARDYYNVVYTNSFFGRQRHYEWLGEYDPHGLSGQRIDYLHGGACLLYLTDNIATLLDSATGCPLLTLDHRSPITCMGLSPDAETLATVQTEYRNHVLLWRIPAASVHEKRAAKRA